MRNRQLGWWFFPTEWKNEKNVPNHQPGEYLWIVCYTRQYTISNRCGLPDAKIEKGLKGRPLLIHRWHDPTQQSGKKHGKHLRNIGNWYIVIYYDILWYIMIYYDILWYIIIYYDILWYIMIYYDILWYIMIYYDILWYIVIYCDIFYMNFLRANDLPMCLFLTCVKSSPCWKVLGQDTEWPKLPRWDGGL